MSMLFNEGELNTYVIGKSYWRNILRKEKKTVGKKDRPKKERSNTLFFTLISSACFPWHSRRQTAPFLDSHNETQKRSTGQRMPHKGSSALSLAQGQLSSFVGIKRNKGLFHRLLMPQDGAATDEFRFRDLRNVQSSSLWGKSLL